MRDVIPRAIRLLRRVGWTWELLLYVPVTVALTWPLSLHFSTRLSAPVGPGDPYLNLWILGWDLRGLAMNPGTLLTGRIFDANIFFPATNTLAYSDHLLLQAVAVWPLYTLTHNIIICYNALLFGSLLASAIAMHLLVRSFTGCRAAAWAAGLVWGFWPYHFAHLLHLQLQALYFLPLAFLFLHRVAIGRRRLDVIGLGVTAGLQAVSSLYYGVMTAVALLVTGIVLVIDGRDAKIHDRVMLLRRLMLASVVAMLCTAPVAWPYLRLQHDGFVRTLYEAEQHSATPLSYLHVPPENVVYGKSGLLPVATATGESEQELFPGFVVLVLAGLGFVHARRAGRTSWAYAMALLIVSSFALSLGPQGLPRVYSLVHRYVFGFQAIRAPARFGMLVTFALAVMAGLGMSEFLRTDAAEGRRPRRWQYGLAGAVLVFMGAEYLEVPLSSVPAPPIHTAVGQWLAQAPAGAVLYLPLYPDAENTPAMVASLEHGRPIVNGYSGLRPPFFPALVDAFNQFPSTEALWTLHDLNVRYIVNLSPVILHPGDATSATPLDSVESSPLVERARFGDMVIYELVWTPVAEAALHRDESPPPPDRGPIPFHLNETTVYEVTWETAPGGFHLPAGTVTIAAQARSDSRPSPCITGAARDRAARGSEPGLSDSAYRLTASVRTADWVSTFFEAEDCFAASSDMALLPLMAEQERKEGRRLVQQTALYDARRHVVRIQNQIPLPISRAARDPLTALFYARTLPLAPGYHVQIPVNEGGRNIQVDLTVAGRETIRYRGQTIRTLRLEPRLIYRVELKRPVQITLWVSDDDRRVPVAIEIAAGFGSFRAELVSYRSE